MGDDSVILGTRSVEITRMHAAPSQSMSSNTFKKFNEAMAHS